MINFKNGCRVAAFVMGLLLTFQLATVANMPTSKEHDTNNIIAQTNESIPAPSIDEKADAIIRKFSDFIESQEKFSFSVETERDLLTTSGVYLQIGHHGNVVVNRPNQFWVDIAGDLVQREFWYDGSTVSVIDPERNIYASSDVSESMDETLDLLIQKLDVNMPLAELLYSDVYEGLIKNVQFGFYYGMSEVDGVLCDHLLFVQDTIDWQVWIENGETPLLRKLAIAYKDREGTPRYTATLSDWNLEPEIVPDKFTFSPPEDAQEVEFVQATPY